MPDISFSNVRNVFKWRSSCEKKNQVMQDFATVIKWRDVMVLSSPLIIFFSNAPIQQFCNAQRKSYLFLSKSQNCVMYRGYIICKGAYACKYICAGMLFDTQSKLPVFTHTHLIPNENSYCVLWR